jgi:C4-dicarboxylate-specific signal transduction histidine kinase
MPQNQPLRAVAQCLFGSIALGVVTFVCFRLRFNLSTTAFLYLLVIVSLSLQGSFLSAAVVSLLGVMGLAYFFAPPIFSLRVDDPFNVVAIIAFLIVSAVITGLMSKLRIRAQQLEDQIIERKRADDALLETRTELERVNRLTHLGQLTASIAHEINQPLTAAVINANACVRWLARDAPDLEEARSAARRSVESSTHASEIINRMRLLFKKGAPQRELVDMNEVIRNIIALVRGELARHSISVRTQLRADLPRIMADRVQLRQLLMNLMINGIDAMKDVDGVRELSVKSQLAEDQHLLVSVGDTGVGLPPQRDRVFDAFFTTKVQGTGMGLSISRSIVESHGGRLWASDNSPRGAIFSLTIPTKA